MPESRGRRRQRPYMAGDSLLARVGDQIRPGSVRRLDLEGGAIVVLHQAGDGRFHSAAPFLRTQWPDGHGDLADALKWAFDFPHLRGCIEPVVLRDDVAFG